MKVKKAIREEKLKRDIQTNSIAGFNDKKGEFRRERIKRMNKNMVWIILLLSQIDNLIIYFSITITYSYSNNFHFTSKYNMN